MAPLLMSTVAAKVFIVVSLSARYEYSTFRTGRGSSTRVRVENGSVELVGRVRDTRGHSKGQSKHGSNCRTGEPCACAGCQVKAPTRPLANVLLSSLGDSDLEPSILTWYPPYWSVTL